MEYNQALLEQIIKELKVEKITAKCLLNCGFSSIEECREFLNPSIEKITPISQYEGLEDVAQRIEQAIENNERVLIYGDYDADGICSTVMLKTFLESKGLEEVNYFIPNRREDGYGMNEESIDEITEQYDPDLFITVDCGITNVNEVDYIYNDLGRDIVVTDHHQPQDALPNCKIFNPHLTKNGAFEDLCGAGVVLRLIERLSSFEESKEYYDLAAIATITDLVKLEKDNRAIVKYGLSVLNHTKRLGLHDLIRTFSKDQLTSQDIGFKLGPRINAAGRISNADSIVELFTEQDPYVVQSLVEEIEEYHMQRQALTKKTAQSVEEELAHYDFNKYPIIVLYNKDCTELIKYPEGKKDDCFEIPFGVKKLDYWSVGDNFNLKKIVIPDTVKEIDGYAFFDCRNVEELSIPNGVKVIKEVAFAICRKMKSITLPNSLSMIERSVFSQCDSLKDVYYQGTKEEWEKISIDSVDNDSLKNCTIHFC